MAISVHLVDLLSYPSIYVCIVNSIFVVLYLCSSLQIKGRIGQLYSLQWLWMIGRRLSVDGTA